MTQPGAPPATVIRAFNGSPGSLVRLHGGQGRSWRAGGVVLKQAGPDSAAPWLGPALRSMPGDPAFRLARPLPSHRGTWTVEGWEATEWLAGRHQPGRWPDAIAVSEAFHRAVRDHVRERPGLPPAVLDVSPYWRPAGFAFAVLVADALAWEGAPPALGREFLARPGQPRQLLARAIAYRVIASARLRPDAPDGVAAEIAGYDPVLALLGISSLT
jgi:hypothetical protein